MFLLFVLKFLIAFPGLLLGLNHSGIAEGSVPVRARPGFVTDGRAQELLEILEDEQLSIKSDVLFERCDY